MSLRDTPHNMNWGAGPVLLQQKGARALGIIRILLNQHRIQDSVDDFSRGEPVFGQPIVPVLGYANIARDNQRAQLFHKLTHAIPSLDTWTFRGGFHAPAPEKKHLDGLATRLGNRKRGNKAGIEVGISILRRATRG